MTLGPLNEVVLYTADMDSQVRFYRDTLELPLAFPRGLEDYSKQYWVVFQTGACALCLHGGGKGEIGADAAKFVFSVDDIEATRTELLERGVPVSEIREPMEGIKVADCRDPEGNQFSIECRRK